MQLLTSTPSWLDVLPLGRLEMCWIIPYTYNANTLTLCYREKQSSDSHYVTVHRGSGCSSSVGKIGGQQYLSLGNGCMIKSTVQHEFIHAIGFDHVQSRPDRNQYITVHYNNIQGGQGNLNFELLPSSWLTWGYEYNARSFMHYDAWAFAIDSSKPTITSKVIV